MAYYLFAVARPPGARFCLNLFVLSRKELPLLRTSLNIIIIDFMIKHKLYLLIADAANRKAIGLNIPIVTHGCIAGIYATKPCIYTRL